MPSQSSRPNVWSQLQALHFCFGYDGSDITIKGSDDRLFVNLVRVIGVAIPIQRDFAFFAGFAGYVLQEFVIAEKAAAILRRASPLAAQELRIQHAGFGSLKGFDYDPMLPVVAHVVDITDLLYASGQ